MRQFKTEGIIIKRRDIGEADRLLTVFTKDQGKITVRASGVRRITSRRAPHTELLTHSMLNLHQGKVMPTLTDIQPIQGFQEIKSDLMKVGFAYHLCELIDGLCPEYQEHASVFHLFKNTLTRLSFADNIAEVVHEFEIELLTILGFYRSETYQPNMDTHSFIEQILERRLRSKRLFPRLS